MIIATIAVTFISPCPASHGTIPSTNKEVQQKMTAPTDNTQKTKTPGETFLEKNRLLPAVVTLPSGLQYKIIRVGTGPKPSLNDSVTVHYAGKLINGTEFDSSYRRHEPATFPVMGVIAGWTEALQLMNVGSTWELYIPSHLAYGSRGAPPSIGSNETLIFTVELISISKPF